MALENEKTKTMIKKINIAAAIFPIIGAIFLTYEEVRDDWDKNESTVFNRELVVMAWVTALGLLLGTTTAGQTTTIAKEEAEKSIDISSKN